MAIQYCMSAIPAHNVLQSIIEVKLNRPSVTRKQYISVPLSLTLKNAGINRFPQTLSDTSDGVVVIVGSVFGFDRHD